MSEEELSGLKASIQTEEESALKIKLPSLLLDGCTNSRKPTKPL